uniref:F-box and leucine-rich repeat protein 13-like n=1 Tax=Myxine glutinosa TaxID=7769 RepID=UPI00358E16E7
MPQCEQLTVQALSRILRKCQALLLLDVSHTHISNASICSLACYSPTPRWLSLVYCCGYTEKGLRYLEACHGCCRHGHLDLSGCVQISFNGYSSVASCCSELRTLILNDLPTLTDSCLSLTDISSQFLARASQFLHYLDISGCVQLSNRSVKLFQNCRNRLRMLIMLYCTGISRTAVLAIRPQLVECIYSNNFPPPWFHTDDTADQLEDTGTSSHLKSIYTRVHTRFNAWTTSYINSFLHTSKHCCHKSPPLTI